MIRATTPSGPHQASPPDSGRVLRWSQWNAIRALDGHVLVTAGAGTGKTFTVVSAILYLLGLEVRTPDGPVRAERSLDLQDIAAITFTNQAAADLKRNLRQALRDHGRADLARRVDGARVGTIHRFCGDVLREFALRTGRDPALRVLEEGEAAALIRRMARETVIDAVERGAPAARTLLEQRPVREVEGWIAGLLDDSAGLDALARGDRLEAEPRALVTLASEAAATLAATLDEMGAVDFDRMIAWTRDLLRDDPRALRSLRRRIRVLIVDEFQDVDPVQKEIAYRLGGLDAAPEPAAVPTIPSFLPGASAPGGPSPSASPGASPSASRRASPTPLPDNVTRLFLVGDPKQSIYRFRRADVTVWTRVRRDFASGMGSVVALGESFRSTPEILGWVDATSGAHLSQPVAGAELQEFEVPYAPLDAIRPGSDQRAVEVLLLPAGADGKRLPNHDARRLEGDWIARRAAALHAAGVPWKEMALLLPAWFNVPRYEEAFAAARIPAYTVRGEGFLERREVVDLITALQAIRTPRDDRALFGFLRGPLVGVRDDTLLRIARHAARPYWRVLASTDPHHQGPGGLAASGDDARRLANAADLLRRFGELRDRVPTALLLARLLEETGYLAHLALAGEPGMEAIANVRQFLARARAASDRSVGDFLADIEERRARERDRVSREVPARLYADDDDVVTITTIHGAKGLEWSVVFCADIARQGGRDPETYLRIGDELLLGEPDTPAAERPEVWQAAAERLRNEEDAERKRQWYVAQTRARDRLLLASIPLGRKPSSGTFARHLVETFPALAGALAGDVPHDGALLPYTDHAGRRWDATLEVASLPPTPPVEGVSTSASPIATERSVARPSAHEPDGSQAGSTGSRFLAAPPPPIPAIAGPIRLSATQMLVRARCEKRHWLKYGLGIPEPDAERHAADDALIRGVVRGRIVHDVLHRYRAPEELADVIEVAIGRWDEHAPPPETDRGSRYREELRAEVDRVLAGPGYAALRAAPGARRELPFLQVHPDGRATQGAIDLAVPPGEGASGWRLVDVKTNRVAAADAEALAASYRPQQDVYVDATRAISGQDVEKFTFAFSGPGVEIDAAPGEALERAAIARADLARGRPARLAEDPAECVFCGFRLVGLCPGVVTGVAADRPPSGDVDPGGTRSAVSSPAGPAEPTPMEPAAPEASTPPAPPLPADGQLTLF